MTWAGSAEGEARLAVLAGKGEDSVRTHAIRLLDPKRPAHLDVLHQAMQAPKDGPDRAEAREVAAEKIASVPKDVDLPAIPNVDVRAEASSTLKELAARKDRVGVDAAIALAGTGDASVRPRLLEELKIPSSMRVAVSAALVRLGHPEDVRALLVDADLDVRDGVACAVLGAK
jgi:hypothetical protein